MSRITKTEDNKNFYIEDSDMISCKEDRFCGVAVNKLGRFETLYESLLNNRIKIEQDMEELRKVRNTKSVKFKELMVKKITNSNTITLFNIHGI